MKNIKFHFFVLLSFVYSISLAQIDSNERAKLYFQEAQYSFNQNNYEQCLVYLDDVEKILGSTNGRILNLRIKSYYNNGQFLKAEKSLNLFIDNYSNSVTPELKSETLSYLVRIERAAKEQIAKSKSDEIEKRKEIEQNRIDCIPIAFNSISSAKYHDENGYLITRRYDINVTQQLESMYATINEKTKIQDTDIDYSNGYSNPGLKIITIDEDEKSIKFPISEDMAFNILKSNRGTQLQFATYRGGKYASSNLTHYELKINGKVALIQDNQQNLARLVSELETCFSNYSYKLGEEELNSQLIDALKKNNYSQIKQLLNSGANPNYKDILRTPAIFYGAYYGNVNTVRLLIDAGADKNSEGFIYTSKTRGHGSLLSIAVKESKIDMVKYLVEELSLDYTKPSYNPKNRKFDGLPPYKYAHYSIDNKGIIPYLFRKWADDNSDEMVNQTGQYFFSWISTGHKEVIQILIDNGMNVNMLHEESGFTATVIAAGSNQIDIKNLLIDNGGKDNFYEQVDEAVKLDDSNYLTASNYLRHGNSNLEQARIYIDRYIASKGDSFWNLFSKAELLVQMGNRKEAKKVISLGMQKAKSAKYGDFGYLERFQELLDQL